MAIYPTCLPREPQSPRSPAPQAPQALSLPPHVAVDKVAGALSIPLDTPSPNDLRSVPAPGLVLQSPLEEAGRPPSTPISKECLRQREVQLKDTSGSRRRRRWANDRLLSNPHITPPTPADFFPAPTHPRKTVHYDLACLWDAKYQQQATAKRDIAIAERLEKEPQIPRGLKAGLKKARGAVGMVRMLEERVREFVDKARDAAAAQVVDVDTDKVENMMREKEEGWVVVEHVHGQPSEDEHEVDKQDGEDIVFMGKKDKAAASPPTRPTTEIPQALPVYHSPPTDPSAPFIRWLVHSIAEYYGLHSWSVTEKTPPASESAIPCGGGCEKGEVRVAYVGLESQKEQGGGSMGTRMKKKDKMRSTGGGGGAETMGVQVPGGRFTGKMPRPLWVIL